MTMSVELTERELAVLARFVDQQTNAEIARDLILAVGTVKWYAQQIYNKLGVSDRKAAVARAQQLGLLHNLRADENAARAPKDVPNNLPAQFTTFIGRERELDQVRQLLMQTRLLTLTGPGGVGKTRLAIQCAGEMLSYFPDGIFWVGLFSLSESTLLIHTLAAALGVRESAEETLLETLQRFLKPRHLLLVLDNYEHLLPDVDLILTLLTAAPHLRVLVTSREALHVIGEQEVAIGPLALPTSDQTVSAQSVTHHPATALFVLRAKAIKPDFEVTDEIAPVITEICRRLDGLPLALELAAARIKLFTPQAMLARLNDSLTMLSSPLLDASGRRHTLRATIDWSYALLNEVEQLLFRRLSVFAGGWTLSAVDALCQDLPPEQVLNGLGSLTDKSLIRPEIQHKIDPEAEQRFSMLHVLREYAQAKLAQSAEANEILHRHVAYFLNRAETAAPELHLAHQEQWLRHLEKEHDNLRVALKWLLAQEPDKDTHQGHADQALRMVAALGWFWVKQDHHTEGFSWVMQVLDHAHATSTELRTKAILFGAGRLAYFVEQVRKGTRELLVEALTWARATEERYCEAWALAYLGLYHEIAVGEYDQAITSCQDALAIFRQVHPIDYGAAWVLNALGVMHALRGNFTVGRTCLEESLTLSHQIENGWGIRLALMNLGLIAYQQGDFAQAHQRFLELFPLSGQMQHRHDLANWLCSMGLVCAGSGQAYPAMVIFSGVDKLLTTNALRLSYPINHFYETRLTELRQTDDPLQDNAWQQGQILSTEEIIEYVLNGMQPSVPA